jgi:hypothetical protein
VSAFVRDDRAAEKGEATTLFSVAFRCFYDLVFVEIIFHQRNSTHLNVLVPRADAGQDPNFE